MVKPSRYALDQLQHGHVAERATVPKDVASIMRVIILLNDPVWLPPYCTAVSHALDRLSFCWPAPVHVRASKSISVHVAPITSPVRAAVRIVNSRARADMELTVRNLVMNAARTVREEFAS